VKVSTRRRLGFSLVAFAFVVMFWGFSQQLPYVIVEPGPAFNVLGEVEGVDVLTVEGVAPSDNPGSLDLLTISVFGSPRQTPTFFELAPIFFSPEQSIVPLEVFYPAGLTTAETESRDRVDFEQSQASAIAAAKNVLPLEVANALKVKLNLVKVSGPSGGLMFALGIVDKATPGSLTGGKKIAGTGTISADGKVGAIGGIDFKMISASRAGDRFFLAPRENCDEVVGHIPAGLQVFAVGELRDALEVLKVISADGDTRKLPVCSAK
jgi:PDZ domain-containing protein